MRGGRQGRSMRDGDVGEACASSVSECIKDVFLAVYCSCCCCFVFLSFVIRYLRVCFGHHSLGYRYTQVLIYLLLLDLFAFL